MSGHRYCQTMFCESCIDRAIAQSEEISEVLSDPTNCAEQRARLHELVAKRRRLVDEAARMGLAPVPTTREYKPLPLPECPPFLAVGQRVRAWLRDAPMSIEGELLEIQQTDGVPWFVIVRQGGGSIGGRPVKIERVP